MPAHTLPDLPPTELHIAGETDTDFTIAIVVPKKAILQHARFIEMLLESVSGDDG